MTRKLRRLKICQLGSLSFRQHISAAKLTGLLLLTGCVEDRLPTEVEVGQPTPVAPSAPTPPAPPQVPAGDNRRSFVWSEESGFTILPNPPGVTLVSANGINGNGEVAGTLIMDAAAGPAIYRGFKWSVERGFTYIIAPGVVTTHVRGIDDQGNVVGYTEQASNRQAFVWNEREGLRALGISVPYLSVLGIRAGVVFGNTLSGGSVAPFRVRLTGEPLEVFRTSSGIGGGLMDTNIRGEAVGYDGNINYGFGGTSDAVMWDQSGHRVVAYDCKAEDDCFAYLAAINSTGLAVGQVKRSELDITRVFEWSRSKGLRYLEVPRAGYEVAVAGVNDDGSILAHNGLEGFIFRPSGGVTVISAPAGHRMVQPRAMNSHGHIVGMIF